MSGQFEPEVDDFGRADPHAAHNNRRRQSKMATQDRNRSNPRQTLVTGVAVGAGSNLFDFFTKGGLKGCFFWLIGFAFFVFIVYNLIVGP